MLWNPRESLNLLNVQEACIRPASMLTRTQRGGNVSHWLIFPCVGLNCEYTWRTLMTFLMQPTPRTVHIVPSDIIRSAAAHQHLMRASGLSLKVTASHKPRSACPPCVWPTRMSHPPPLHFICSDMFFLFFFFTCHWQCDWKGAGFSLGDSLKLKFHISREWNGIGTEAHLSSQKTAFAQWNKCWLNSQPYVRNTLPDSFLLGLKKN